MRLHATTPPERLAGIRSLRDAPGYDVSCPCQWHELLPHTKKKKRRFAASAQRAPNPRKRAWLTAKKTLRKFAKVVSIPSISHTLTLLGPLAQPSPTHLSINEACRCKERPTDK